MRPGLQKPSAIMTIDPWVTASEGKNHNALHYKLPAIIAVGYRDPASDEE